jgi:hypothetical protein
MLSHFYDVTVVPWFSDRAEEAREDVLSAQDLQGEGNLGLNDSDESATLLHLRRRLDDSGIDRELGFSPWSPIKEKYNMEDSSDPDFGYASFYELVRPSFKTVASLLDITHCLDCVDLFFSCAKDQMANFKLS